MKENLQFNFSNSSSELAKNNWFYKLKNQITKKSFIISLILFALVVFLVSSFFIPVTLPYNKNKMYVEPIKCTVTKKTGCKPIDKNDSNFKNAITQLRIGYKGINTIGQSYIYRTIDRNGEKIKLIYYCYEKPLFFSLFIDPDLQPFSESGARIGIDQPSTLYSYESQPTEVYYMKGPNLYKYDKVSDKDFDELRKKSDLIWSGVIDYEK